MNNPSNLIRQEDNEMQSNTQNQNVRSNFVNDFINNPKEAIAKEIMNKAEENISKGWSSWCECCNLEYFSIN